MTRKRLSPPAWADGKPQLTDAVIADGATVSALVGGGSAS